MSKPEPMATNVSPLTVILNDIVGVSAATRGMQRMHRGHCLKLAPMTISVKPCFWHTISLFFENAGDTRLARIRFTAALDRPPVAACHTLFELSPHPHGLLVKPTSKAALISEMAPYVPATRMNDPKTKIIAAQPSWNLVLKLPVARM